MYTYGERSRDRLATCHPILQLLFNEVIKEVDCSILEGVRTQEVQDSYLYTGRSKTRNSKHLMQSDGYSHAVDVVPYPVDWKDKERQKEFANIVYDKAMQLGIRVKWGGRFKGFYDSPHWEIIT